MKKVARSVFDYEYKEDVSKLAEYFYDAALIYSKGGSLKMLRNL